MTHFYWEDPFGETQENEPSKLWLPEQKTPPVRLKQIRDRQKRLLLPIHDLRKASVEVLKRVGGRPGGEFLLSNLQVPVAVEVLFRHPDYSDVLLRFGPIPIVSHPVTLPAEYKTGIPFLDRWLPTQRISDIDRRPDGKAMLHPETELGLVRQQALSGGDVTRDRIVVYPEVLRFIGHWIGHLKSPISDIRYTEIRSGYTIREERSLEDMLARQAARKANAAAPALTQQ